MEKKLFLGYFSNEQLQHHSLQVRRKSGVNNYIFNFISSSIICSGLRRHCVCGVNRVTRCLERDELQLVMVDRSSPWQLHQHLAQLSAVRQCKAIAIDNLCSVLSPLLSVTRLCAVGFKVYTTFLAFFKNTNVNDDNNNDIAFASVLTK